MKTIPTIDEAAAYSDSQIADLLGHPKEMKSFKAEIKAMAALTGKARTAADAMWQTRMEPHISGDSIGWMRVDAIAKAKKSPKETLDSADPSSVM